MTGEAPGSEERARRRRVFFALWPDDATRNAISRASRRVVRLCGGRPTAKRNLHITVAFLGGLDVEQLERVSQVPPIPVGAFELELDTLAYFDGAKALSLVPRSVPPPLAELERALWDRLEREGFEREPRIYRPHLTLARRARPVEEPVTPVRWPVAALTLVESIPLPRSVHYEPLEHWRL